MVISFCSPCAGESQVEFMGLILDLITLHLFTPWLRHHTECLDSLVYAQDQWIFFFFFFFFLRYDNRQGNESRAGHDSLGSVGQR